MMGNNMEIYRLPKPDKANVDEKLISVMQEKDFPSFVEVVNEPDYLYWDKARFKSRPEGITAEQFWALIRILRRISSARIKSPVKDEKGNYFSWQLLSGMSYFLHEVDMQLGDAIESIVLNGKMSKQRFITRGIMEEAIASSQLEGANTTRKAAKKMLIEKRTPKNRSEQMIMNNYQAMLNIEEKLKNRPMSIPMLLDLHTILTENTIDAGDVGRFRKDEDNIVVCDPSSNIVYLVPPSGEFMKVELDKLIDFANDNSPKYQFAHPLIKAIILHFWIAYLHPFTDGNGRLARAIFYWYLLNNEYWGFSYLPVSRVIRNSPAQYRDAYVYTEQDDNDLTYFIDYNLKKIRQAKIEFDNYIKRKTKESREIADNARFKYNLNDRQIQILRFLHKNSNESTNIKLHSKIYEISRITARKDLEELERAGLLNSKKVGRERLFSGTSKMSEIFP
jgi:Fic family protein